MHASVEQPVNIGLPAPLHGFRAVIDPFPINDGTKVIDRVSHGMSCRMGCRTRLPDGMTRRDIRSAVDFFGKRVAVQNLTLRFVHFDSAGCPVSCSVQCLLRTFFYWVLLCQNFYGLLRQIKCPQYDRPVVLYAQKRI